MRELLAMDEISMGEDERFNASGIPGYDDSDWPQNPQMGMLSWIPNDVQKRFGRMDHD